MADRVRIVLEVEPRLKALLMEAVREMGDATATDVLVSLIEVWLARAPLDRYGVRLEGMRARMRRMQREAGVEKRAEALPGQRELPLAKGKKK